MEDSIVAPGSIEESRWDDEDFTSFQDTEAPAQIDFSSPPEIDEPSRQVVWLGCAEVTVVLVGLLLQLYLGSWVYFVGGVLASFGIGYLFRDVVPMPPSFARES